MKPPDLASGALLILALCLVPATTATPAQDEFALERLTVPPSRLVPGCGLVPSDTAALEGNSRRRGLWLGLPIPANPWRGHDREIVVAIRERVATSPPPPDGPPPSRSQLAWFRLQLADDVEEAYAAAYTEGDVPGVTVAAVTFKVLPTPDRLRGADSSPGRVRLVRGRTVIIVSGDGGACFQSVVAHLREITAG